MANEPITEEALLRYLKELRDRRFYGEVTLQIRGGNIMRLKPTETLEADDLTKEHNGATLNP